MSEGYIDFNAVPAQRPVGIPTTRVTNELAAALSRIRLSDGGGTAGRAPVVVKVTDNEAGGGKYTCAVYTTSRDICDPSRSTTSTDIEKQKLIDRALFINMQEVGGSTHWLTHASNTQQKFFHATFFGFTPETPARAVFVANVIWVKACPTTP